MFLCARSFSLNLTYALLRNDLRTNLGWFSAQHFINEAPGDRKKQERERRKRKRKKKKKKKKAAGKVNREGGERERKKENGG